MRVLTGSPWAQRVVRWTAFRSLPAVVSALIVHGQPDLSGAVQEAYKEKAVVPGPPEWGEAGGESPCREEARRWWW